MTTNQPTNGLSASVEYYEELLLDLSDYLEGGDTALDFDDYPRAVITIGHLMAIIRAELNIIEEKKYMAEVVWLIQQRGEQE